jgi:homoserine kinase
MVKLPARKTEYARSVLTKVVEMSKVVENVANSSTIVSGFAFNDIELIWKGMSDAIVDGARKKMIPGYDLVKERATGAGASGVCISGAGPSMLAIVDGMKRAKKVLDSLLIAFTEAGVESRGFVTRVGKGARVVEGK